MLGLIWRSHPGNGFQRFSGNASTGVWEALLPGFSAYAPLFFCFDPWRPVCLCLQTAKRYYVPTIFISKNPVPQRLKIQQRGAFSERAANPLPLTPPNLWSDVASIYTVLSRTRQVHELRSSLRCQHIFLVFCYPCTSQLSASVRWYCLPGSAGRKDPIRLRSMLTALSCRAM